MNANEGMNMENNVLASNHPTTNGGTGEANHIDDNAPFLGENNTTNQ